MQKVIYFAPKVIYFALFPGLAGDVGMRNRMAISKDYVRVESRLYGLMGLPVFTNKLLELQNVVD
jgi:hypothetical protein